MSTIWILNHHANTPTVKGSTRHYELSKWFNKNGHDTLVFNSNYRHYAHKDLIKTKKKYVEKSYSDVKFVHINTKPHYKKNGIMRLLNMISYYLFLMCNYKKFKKPDIIIGSTVHLFACLAAIRIAKKYNIPGIIEIRDLWPESLVELGRISRRNPLVVFFSILERYVYINSDKIVTVLPNVYEYLKKFHIERNKIFYIPNGISTSTVLSKQSTERISEYFSSEDLQNFNNKKNIIYTGSIGVANNLDFLLDIAKDLNIKDNSILFSIIGSGSEKQRLLKRCENENINNVKFFNPVPKNLLPAIYQYSELNIIVLENTELYRFGISMNKLFDYLLSGVPIFLIGKTYNNIVKDSHAGIYYEKYKVGECSNKILEYFNLSEDIRSKMGKLGKEYVLKYHDYEILAEKYLSILEVNNEMG